MKKFQGLFSELKTGTYFIFTFYILFSAIIGLINGATTLKLTDILMVLVISVIGSLINYIAFSEKFIKSFSYTLRLLLFAISYYIALAALAVLYDWFPVDNLKAWLSFTVQFVVITVISTIGFEIHCKVTGRKYDGLLGQYKKKKEQENGDK